MPFQRTLKPSIPFLPPPPHHQRLHHLLVQSQQILHPLPLTGEPAAAIQSVHGAVEGLVRLAEIGRHEVGVVEIGERGVRMGGAGVEHGLCERFQFGNARTIRMEAGRQGERCCKPRRRSTCNRLSKRPVIARIQAICMADVSRAKSARVASGRRRSFWPGILGGASQPIGMYSRFSELTFGTTRNGALGSTFT